MEEEKKNKYGYLSRDTYNNLKFEIENMPVEEVHSLPSDLQVWINGQRPDLEGKLQLATHTVQKDSSITKDTERHFEAVWQLAREWSKQIYHYNSEDDLGSRKLFPTKLKSSDAYLGPHQDGSLKWSVHVDGSVEVSFEIERHLLFGALREHLASDELWTSYEELKSTLAKGIKQAGEKKTDVKEKDTAVRVTDEISPVRQRLMKELETLLAKHKHWLPGRCQHCP